MSEGRRSHAWAHAAAICRLYTEDKLSLTEIGETYNCEHSTVRRILEANKVPLVLTRVGRRKYQSETSIGYPAHQHVSRDPCPRCNIRADHGCSHTAAALTMGAW